MTRLIVPTLLVALTGCGSGGITLGNVNLGGSKQATEEKNLTAPHVAGSGIEVTTDLASVEVAADPSLKEVKIVAKITANGNTDEEAKQRLGDIRIDVGRRPDGVLAIAARPKEEGKPIHASCSFVVHVPDVNGSKARSGNGPITLTGLGGHADAHSGIGSVAVTGNKGSVVAHSGNGTVVVRDAGGDVTADSSIGTVTVENATGFVKAKSGNGTVTVARAGGADAESSIGAVSVRDVAGDVTARSGNGTVAVEGTKGAVTAHSSIGRVSVHGAGGMVDAESGNGSVDYSATADNHEAFHLKSSIGSVGVRLSAGVGGTIKATTSIGSITVNGSRKAKSVAGGRGSKTIVLSDGGPTLTAHSGNGSVTISLE